MRICFRPPGRVRWPVLVLLGLLLAGSAVLLSSDLPPFSPTEKAFYLDQATVNFVRPGLVFQIVEYTIGQDGTFKVHFKLTDPKGLPLDRDGITTPGNVSTTFLLARIPKGGEFYQDYNSRVKTSTYAPTLGKQAKQAGTDSGGTYTKVTDGEYWYTFKTKLPAGYPTDATYTIGMYGSRNLSEFDLGTNYATTLFHFVPNGGTPAPRDVIGTASCNKCHYDLSFHGGSRKGIGLCVMCHAPAYEDVTNLNPETGNTIDLKVMVHKIHMGANLPSVQAGTPYTIVGYGNAVSDFSDVELPSGPNNCAWCHDGNAKQGDAWLTSPSRDACGACHDNVNFATGANHVNQPQISDNQCKNCHIPQGELDFDASIKGAHISEGESSLLKGIVADIKSVENAGPGKKIIVNFTVKDNQGNTYDITKMNRVALVLAGPTDDYVAVTSHGYVSEDPRATATLTGDTYRYTFNTALPANAGGTYSVGIEARNFEVVLAGTTAERNIEYGALNKVLNFSVDGSAVTPRRQIVSNDKCNGCHRFLSLHGTNRNRVEQCVLCHNPVENDAARRPAAQLPAESVDFALMIHRIHAGDQQVRPYIIYGFGGSVNQFNDITFPGGLNNCSLCHVGTSNSVPVAAKADISDPRGLLNPVKPATGACTGCHTSVDAASHALANTSALGESCGACHGAGKDYDVAKVHAN
jgi:OmcA/MtrC family decaheme c-type cytochrome